ncbi:hypothetical protein ACP4OV_020600 [Aristida adscensionis]
MASTQESREERARSAAQKAADELAAARRDDRGHGQDAAAGAGSPRGGILGSLQESARSVMGAVRGTFSSSGGGAGAGESATMGKAGEAKDAAAEEARGAMDAAKAFATERKEGARQALAGDAVARKGETNESAWQQGQDVRRRAAEKAEEMKRAPEPSEAEKGRSATENIYGKARGAVGAFGEKMVMPTDVVEQKRAEAAAGWKATTAAGSRGDEHGNARGMADAAMEKAAETKDAAADKARGAMDKAAETKDAAAAKVRGAMDAAGERARSARDAAAERASGGMDAAGEAEEDVMLRVKAADQMTGQAFNDVGVMGEEGTGMPRARR